MTQAVSHHLTALERRATWALTALFSLRMLGLFIILPVFSLYATTLSGATPFLVGLGFGAYALTQMLLQPLFGWLADRYGRKPTIYVGLLLFIIGSIVVALSEHIYGVIAGRAVQGAGAISAAVLALTADLVREQVRTKVMAVIGVSIGLTFGIAMFLGPILQGGIGVAGIFWLCALLALLGIGITWRVIPDPAHQNIPIQPTLSTLALLKQPDLLRLNIGALMLHGILAATFVALPWLLTHAALQSSQHWHVYLPAFALSILVMGGLIRVAERRQQLKFVFLAAIVCLLIASGGLALGFLSLWIIGLWITLFFIGFNVMEASQPSLVAKFCPPAQRGSAMGIFSSCQYLGTFVGSVLGGAVYGHYQSVGVFVMTAIMALLWLFIALNMSNPKAVATAS